MKLKSRSSLLRKFESLTRASTRIEAQLADLRTQLCLSSPSSTSRPSRLTRRPRTLGQSIDLVRDALRVLQAASAPLPCCEVAHRLGIKRHAAKYRLKKAIELGFVDKIDGGRYRVVEAISEISA